jgi:hypothetical protein
MQRYNNRTNKQIKNVYLLLTLLICRVFKAILNILELPLRNDILEYIRIKQFFLIPVYYVKFAKFYFICY